jgi:hypothetical protein
MVYAGEADPNFPSTKRAAAEMRNVTFFSLPGLNHDQCGSASALFLPHVKSFFAEVNK